MQQFSKLQQTWKSDTHRYVTYCHLIRCPANHEVYWFSKQRILLFCGWQNLNIKRLVCKKVSIAIEERKSSVRSCRAKGSSPDFSLNCQSKINVVDKIYAAGIYQLIIQGIFIIFILFSRCGVVRVSKMRVSFICKILQLKMQIMVITYLHSIRAAKVNSKRLHLACRPVAIRTRRKTRQFFTAWFDIGNYRYCNVYLLKYTLEWVNTLSAGI